MIPGGHIVPSGANVTVHFHHIHRSPKYYHNPENFDPSHFYAENASNRHPFAFLPFSGGPRNCIGQKFAMMEVKTVLAVFFKQYEIESLTKLDDLVMIPDILMRPRDGPIGVIHIGSAENAQTILSSTTHLDKSFVYDFFKPWLGSGLLISTGEKWHHRRRLLTPAFHFTILEKFFGAIVANSKLLVTKLDSKTNLPKFNIVPYLTECSLLNICETAMGVKMDKEIHLRDDYLKSSHIYNETMFDRMMNPLLHPAALFRLSSKYKRQMDAVELLHKMSNNVIQKRIAERQRFKRGEATLSNDSKLNGRPKTIHIADSDLNPKLGKREFLDVLLDISEQDPGSFTINDVREEVDTFMFEGHDTVSIALYWTVYLVGLHPDIQEKVHTELDDVLGSAEAPANLKTLQELKYLECVIKESLRLYPSVPWVSRTSGEDVIIGKKNCRNLTCNKTILYNLEFKKAELPILHYLHQDID
ncbi:hypothetical protein V9T40_000490 [Parthenolecanium corni]|uniref:Cytochrome P450 n=1 Tax=Parthenolecanium corni TaxID=536013 RepID=A0AAN9TB50_9HEMI